MSTIRIEIFDGTTPMLEKIQLLSHGMALEMLSVAGSHVQREARVAMRKKSHNWHQVFRNGKIVAEKGELRELGLRISHVDGSLANPNSMSNMITSYLNERAMVATVGGRHKAFTPTKRKDGVATGKLKRVGSVGKQTHGILHKLNFGGRLNQQLPYYKRGDNPEQFKYVKYTGYGFMAEGYNNAKSAVVDAMTTRYERLLHVAVNRADIKVRRRSS